MNAAWHYAQEAWWFTRLIMAHPDYAETVKWVREGGSGRAYPAEELVERVLAEEAAKEGTTTDA